MPAGACPCSTGTSGATAGLDFTKVTWALRFSPLGHLASDIIAARPRSPIEVFLYRRDGVVRRYQPIHNGRSIQAKYDRRIGHKNLSGRLFSGCPSSGPLSNLGLGSDFLSSDGFFRRRKHLAECHRQADGPTPHARHSLR